MNKKIKSIEIVLLLFVFMFTCFIESVRAVTLLTEEEALSKIFPGAEQVVSEVKTASDSQLADIKKQLGGSLTAHEKGNNQKDIEKGKEFTFYFSIKDGKKTGAAIILTEPGSWGPIELIVGITPDAKITRVIVMRYTEVRGRPIARGSFLKQFAGKGLGSGFTLGKEIRAVSGATLSSYAAVFTIKKALVLYEKLCEKAGND
ncbi:MAG: FMN-binding protein [Candidatus Omnitrophica bacterium]|nr:FMN-binding protein [Candidatus Omnitrophota bacterium]